MTIALAIIFVVWIAGIMAVWSIALAASKRPVYGPPIATAGGLDNDKHTCTTDANVVYFPSCRCRP